MLPQLIYLGIVLLGLGVSLAEHGKPKQGYNSFLQNLLATAITIGLLYWGGFFDVLLK